MIEPDQIDLTLIVISAFYHKRVQHGAAITCTTLANLTHLYKACCIIPISNSKDEKAYIQVKTLLASMY